MSEQARIFHIEPRSRANLSDQRYYEYNDIAYDYAHITMFPLADRLV